MGGAEDVATRGVSALVADAEGADQGKIRIAKDGDVPVPTAVFGGRLKKFGI